MSGKIKIIVGTLVVVSACLVIGSLLNYGDKEGSEGVGFLSKLKSLTPSVQAPLKSDVASLPSDSDELDSIIENVTGEDSLFSEDDTLLVGFDAQAVTDFGSVYDEATF